MEQYYATLKQSIDLYQRLFSLISEAVTIAMENSFEELGEKTRSIRIVMDQIETTDKQLITHCRAPGVSVNNALWQEREQLMKDVLQYHNRQLPHLSSILAVKKAEMQKIRVGRRGMNGYHSGSKQSGKHIENSY